MAETILAGGKRFPAIVQLVDEAGNVISLDKQPAISDVGPVTGVGANTGTAGTGLSAIGDTTLADQSAVIMNDLRALQEDVAALQASVNSILTALRGYGVIA